MILNYNIFQSSLDKIDFHKNKFINTINPHSFCVAKKDVRIYEEEVNQIVNRSASRYSLIQMFSKFNFTNKLIRLLTYRKQKVIFYSLTKRN